jgi:superfamily II DNA or RNA helicase
MDKTPDEYQAFLQSKLISALPSGIDVDPAKIHGKLFPFQRDITIWALKKGRAAVFADTGLGKTFIQLEWARLLNVPTLIVAPLSVARQTIREAAKIDIDIKYVRRASDVKRGKKIWITNYDMIEHFDPAAFGAVVLDESSILKALDGKTRRLLTDMFSKTPYRLACTATPAPNDRAEIGNHAEFLGVMKTTEMLATFFIHANRVIEHESMGMKVKTKLGNAHGQEWRLKWNARDSFYRWMASWAMSIRKPSDLGYDDDGYILPTLTISPTWVDVEMKTEGQLFFGGLSGISGRNKARRATLEDRVATAADLVNKTPGQWIVWTGLNYESSEMTAAIPDGVEIVGADSPEHKADAIEAFQDGRYRVLITKPSIAGFGMNFQNAANMVFVGLNDSWEMYYQAIRRCWRFGQKSPVNVYVVLSTAESAIYENVMMKEAVAQEMSQELISAVKKYEENELNKKQIGEFDYQEETISGGSWTAMMGDSCRRLKEIPADSIHLSVYSPPFADLYTYSNSEMDLGNSRTWGEFFAHYKFIIGELLRVTMPGRVTCAHTADIPAMGVKDGYIGIKDFPGEVIKAYSEAGWIFHGRAIVTKNPQAQAIRTKAKALLFVQLRKDSASSRPAILDQILIFRKPGDNPIPIRPVEHGELDNETWIDWAGGIWTGIHESDTLQYHPARAASDEKHICPLQLGTIERCIKLYSNPGETVLTPFMGIGSEAYQAVRFGRRAIGIELKESYYRVAVDNLRHVESEANRSRLF